MIARRLHGAVAMLLAALLLSACAAGTRLGLSDKEEKTPQTQTDLNRENTPDNRATQVAWTAARAQYCAFNMRPDKLRADYLAYEQQQGLSPEEMANITRIYDLAYNTFYAQVREVPTYCTRERIEEIRPDINRHLAGDYSHSPRKPQRVQVDLPPETSHSDEWEKRKEDPAQHMEPR